MGQRAQRLTEHVLHYQKQLTSVFAEIVEANNVGVREQGERARLAAEALAKDWAAGPLREQELDRHLRAQLKVGGQVDLAVATGAEHAIDAILVEQGRCEAATRHRLRLISRSDRRLGSGGSDPGVRRLGGSQGRGVAALHRTSKIWTGLRLPRSGCSPKELKLKSPPANAATSAVTNV